ncbi:C4-dicarboxylate ABC transporter [Burkholderia sp. Bp9126]|nr:C4-dicarboxylate ABC transporter [Burkholderia sp. Bp9126]
MATTYTSSVPVTPLTLESIVRSQHNKSNVCPARRPFAEKIRQFTPNWFAMTMGNGIVFLVLAALPYPLRGKDVLAAALWGVDIIVYVAFALMFAARWICFPKTIRPMLQHPVQSMFLGALPMGLVPIINGTVIFAGKWFGNDAYAIAHAMWWFDAALALVVAIGVPYLAFTSQSHAPERLSAVLLLPIVAPEVAASSAAVIAPHLEVHAAQTLIGVGYALWAVSVPLAFLLLAIICLRLVIHKLPPRELGASSWLPLGPVATGALGLLALGQAAPAAFAGTKLASAATFAHHFGIVGAALLWGAGVWWLIIAILFTIRYCREGLPFNLGWWGFTFPLGVYALATLALSRSVTFDSLTVIGMTLVVLLGLVWIVVLGKTVIGATRGELLHAPCLANQTTSAR